MFVQHARVTSQESLKDWWAVVVKTLALEQNNLADSSSGTRIHHHRSVFETIALPYFDLWWKALFDHSRFLLLDLVSCCRIGSLKRLDQLKAQLRYYQLLFQKKNGFAGNWELTFGAVH